MPEKAPKAKAKPRASERNVLGTLPATRPDRMGAPRGRAKAAPKRAATRAHDGPQAVRPGSPPLRTRPADSPPPPKPLGAPTGTELVTTAIRATGELAQIGLTVGGHAVKRVLGRLPRP